MDKQLRALLERGDRFAVIDGRFVARTKSGKAVPEDWQDRLLAVVVKSEGLRLYRYTGYSTGFYGAHKAGGVTLRFSDILSHESRYAIFNADLRRRKDSAKGRKGGRLPGKRFNPPKAGEFMKFWLRTGCRMPRRKSEFHSAMYRLEGRVFVAEMRGIDGKLRNGSIRPLNVAENQFTEAIVSAGKELAGGGQRAGIGSAKDDGKHSAESLGNSGFQTNQAAGDQNYESSKQDNAINDRSISPLDYKKGEGAVDPWLDAYEQAEGQLRH